MRLGAVTMRAGALALMLVGAAGSAWAHEDALTRSRDAAAARAAVAASREAEMTRLSAAAEAAYRAREGGAVRLYQRPEPVSFGLAERVTWYAPVFGKPFCEPAPTPWRWARAVSQFAGVEGVVASVEEIADDLFEARILWRTQRREVTLLSNDLGRCQAMHRAGNWMPRPTRPAS